MPDKIRILDDRMLSPTAAATLKGMTLNQFKHHLKKPGAPQPYSFGVPAFSFYDPAEIAAWTPNVQPQKGRKTPEAQPQKEKKQNTREGVTAGKTANLGVTS